MLLTVLAIFLHIFSNYTTHNRILTNNSNNKPLFDIIHNYSNDFSEYKYVPDFLAFFFLIPLIICNKNIGQINHFIYISSILIILRSLTIIVTDLPKSDINCDQTELKTYNLLFGHCYDKIFSGHTALTLVALLTARKYELINDLQFIIFLVFHVLYSFFIIITRSHYTVDVLLSYFITVLTFLCSS